ncbi:MAG: serine hydrolase domain-containing protein [Pseudomonadota bacterium]
MGVTRSSIAIAHNGAIVASYGIGRAADEPVPVASLSKAVTGACVAALVDERVLSYDTRLGDLLADRPDLLGVGDDIEIGSLLTHTSGLRPDQTQSVLNPTLWGAADMHDQFATLALSREPGENSFFYNNENYAVLGAVIMHVTGESVEDACGSRVLPGLESASADARMGGGLAWGGWTISVADYTRFVAGLSPINDWPRAALGEISYGPGVFIRPTPDGQNHWHFGGFCLWGFGDHGAFFVALDNGWTITTQYDVCLSGEQSRDLSIRLSNAAYEDG